MLNRMLGIILSVIISFFLVSDRLARGVKQTDRCLALSGGRHDFINMCENSTVNDGYVVHISTRLSTQQYIECKCSVEPTITSKPYIYHINVKRIETELHDSLEFSFNINNQTIVDNANVAERYLELVGGANISYTSPNNTNAICFQISVFGYGARFSMVCESPWFRNDTEETSIYTVSTKDTTEPSQNTQTSNVQTTLASPTVQTTVENIPTYINENDRMIWIAVYVCTPICVFAMIVTIIMVVVLICNKRKQKEYIPVSNDLSMANINNDSGGRELAVYEQVAANVNLDQENEYNQLSDGNDIPNYVN